MKDFKILDFSMNHDYRNDDLGIFHPVLGRLYPFDTRENSDLRYNTSKYYKINLLLGYGKLDSEIVEEISTTIIIDNLLKYQKTKKSKLGSKTFSHDFWDYETMSIEIESFGKLVNFHKERLFRKIKESNIIPENKTYINVDEFTSFYGNYKINNVECVELSYGKRTYEKLESIEGFNFKINLLKNLSNYDLSRPLSDKVDFYKKSDKFKLDFINKNLTINEKFNLVEKLLKDTIYDNKEWGTFCEYYIRLSGNDDDSWTRYFLTQKEMEEELKYLYKMQPINKDADIHKRNYVFTN